MNNVVERIQAFNQDREPQLIQLKYRAMRTDAFAFLRGTDHLFYEDWPSGSPLNDAPPTWICGDLHWQNLGSYKGDNRLVYFDINDFDESVLAPCTWDVARMLVSILVSAPDLKIKPAKALRLCTYFLEVYTKQAKKGRIYTVEEGTTTGIAKELLFQVRARSPLALLNSRTKQTPEGRKLLINGTQTTAATEAERTKVTTLVEDWGAKHTDPRFYTVLDVAHRIAGIGSLGVERYILLVKGKGSPDHNFLLDLKFEPSSSLEPYLPLRQPQWTTQAERSVSIQNWMQAIPPALLAPLQMDDKSYVLRELQPEEDKVNVALLKGKLSRLEKLVKTIAKVIAWGQLRSGGHQGSVPAAHDLIDFVQKSSWQDELLAYAKAYATRVEEDYRAFCSAYDSGLLESTSHALSGT